MKQLSIRTKLIAFITLSLLSLTIAITVISVTEVKNILLEKSYTSLAFTRDLKANLISSYFFERLGDINVLSKSENVRQLIDKIESVHEEITKQQIVKEGEDFPINDPRVIAITKPFEEFFQNFKSAYGYDDILIVDRADGHVLYTAQKKSDGGANLLLGNLKNSGLGEVFEKVSKLKRIVLVDMKPYTPNDNEPEIFIGAPIIHQGDFDAVLVFKLSYKAINKVMHERQGYGKSQEDYLVGQDKLMRSDSYLKTTHSVRDTQNNKIDTVSVNQTLQGKKGVQLIEDYRGVRVLSAYSPLKIGEDLNWIIVSEIDESEVLEKQNQITFAIVGISFIVLLLVLLGSIAAINKIIINRLVSFQDGLLEFFKYINGEISNVQHLKVNADDEIGHMTIAVNQGIEQISKTLNKEEEQRWIKNGINNFNESLIGHTQKVDISLQALTFVSQYLEAGVGVLYLLDEESNILKQYASYAHI